MHARQRPTFPAPPVLTTSDAAAMLGVAVSTVQKWVESGQLASWKTPGGHRRIPLTAVQAFLGDATAPAPLIASAGSSALRQFDASATPDAAAGSYVVLPDEPARVRAVAATGLLDTPAQRSYDRLARLASQVVDTPVALISLLTNDRKWFMARIGTNVSEIPRAWAFCNYTVLGDDMLTVEDATRDSRFVNNPLVTGPEAVRFYAGCALHSRDGYRLGTLCVLDRKARRLTGDQAWALQALTALVSDEIQRGTAMA